MSRICIGVLSNSGVTLQNLYSELSDIRDLTDISISYGLPYTEPLLEQYVEKDRIVFNFTDKNKNDTCEMLFLPDNCFYNGFENLQLFTERMKKLEMLLIRILKFTSSLDLFVGESGTRFDEFEEVVSPIHDFLRVSNSLNVPDPPDLHFILTR